MIAWLPTVLRWSARVTGVLLVGMVLMFLVGEGLPDLFRQPPRVQLEFAALFMMAAGFLTGWQWERVGGLLAIVGFAAFSAVELTFHGKLPGGVFPLFVAPGVLYLLSYVAGPLCTNRQG